MIETVRRRALLLGAFLSTTLVPGAVHAGCTTSQDASTVKRSISRAVRCNDKKLKKGPTATCTLTPAPACAGSLVTDAVALAYGANNPPTAAVDGRALRTQLKCQKRIGKAVSSYVGTKLRGLARGQDLSTLETRAAKPLGQIPERCLVNVGADATSGLLVPAVGP